MSGQRRVLAGLGAAVAIFGATTAKLMIWPVSGMPAHVDAIVMMAGPGTRSRW